MRMNVQINWANLSSETLEDRRGGKRVTLQFRVEVIGMDVTETPYVVFGRTRNVSHHGCCFEVARSIAPGEKLSLRVIRLNSAGEHECTDALPFRAAWVIQEENLWVVGAEMVKVASPWGVAFPDAPAPVEF
jgi:hypothetical protein